MSTTTQTEYHKLALAIDPTPRGFGYALFEGPQTPLDWGTTEIRSEKNENSLERIKKLIKFYSPEILVLENCSDDQGRRCPRVKELLEQITEFARLQKISVAKYSTSRVQEVFAMNGVRTKQQVAEKICEWLPKFACYLPPDRKIWMSEDRRMGIFDAIALILTYYYLEE
jgi:Holliday junction resolvasome RuvABC endonuclease subunit